MVAGSLRLPDVVWKQTGYFVLFNTIKLPAEPNGQAVRIPDNDVRYIIINIHHQLQPFVIRLVRQRIFHLFQRV